MNVMFLAVVRILELMFVIGVTGCIITIPLVAYKMFRVLWRDDDPQEE
jgi:hypothetical protein